jgi:hypothetical protein
MGQTSPASSNFLPAIGQKSLASHNWVATHRVDKSGIQQALSQRALPVDSTLCCGLCWFCWIPSVRCFGEVFSVYYVGSWQCACYRSRSRQHLYSPSLPQESTFAHFGSRQHALMCVCCRACMTQGACREGLDLVSSVSSSTATCRTWLRRTAAADKAEPPEQSGIRHPHGPGAT